ncbi:MAG: sulfurtransferase TusA family protein [Thermodesulfobacteriota bacterium]|nr:sulfurtransferase TusA family protein [Thermodesulfobacteriota bacterium]
MTETLKLDFRGMVAPLNLLKCQRCLKDMKSGDILEVLLSDADVIADLTTIIARSSDTVAYQKIKEDGIHLGIRKG